MDIFRSCVGCSSQGGAGIWAFSDSVSAVVHSPIHAWHLQPIPDNSQLVFDLESVNSLPGHVCLSFSRLLSISSWAAPTLVSPKLTSWGGGVYAWNGGRLAIHENQGFPYPIPQGFTITNQQRSLWWSGCSLNWCSILNLSIRQNYSFSGMLARHCQCLDGRIFRDNFRAFALLARAIAAILNH